MPLENFNDGKSAPKAESADPMLWAEAALIVFDSEPMRGSAGDRLRKTFDAETMMADELGKMSLAEFKGIDGDSDGFLTKKEMQTAIDSQTPGARKDALQFLENNLDSFQKLSNDEFFFENSGVTRKDLDKIGEELNERFDENTSKAMTQALREENLSDIVSIVRQMGDRIDRMPDVFNRTSNQISNERYWNSPTRPVFLNSKVQRLNDNKAGEVDISTGTFHMKVSTDKNVPVKATIETDVFYGSVWQKPSRVVSELGNAARGGRVKEPPTLGAWDLLIKEQAQKKREQQMTQINPESWQHAMQNLTGNAQAKGTLGEHLRQQHSARLMMGTAMNNFALDGFDIADRNKNGFLSKTEIETARANTPDQVVKDLLQYSKENFNEIESVSSSELDDLTGNGITRSDFEGFRDYSNKRFDNELAWGLRKSLETNRLNDVDSVVKEMHDRLDRLQYITSRASQSAGNNLKLEARITGSPLLEKGRIDAKIPNQSWLRLSTDYEPEGYKWTPQGYFGKELKQVQPQSALDGFGDKLKAH